MTIVAVLRRLGLAVLAMLALAPPAEAGTWLDPQLPFGPSASDPVAVGVAMAPDGTLVLARFTPDGTLEVRERPPGGPVGGPVIVPPVTAHPQPSPDLQVLTGEDGSAAVLFDAGSVRYASLRRPGGAWSAPEPISPASTPPGPAAVAPDGAVWAVARDPTNERGLAVFRMAAGGDAQYTPLPAAPGARDSAPRLTVPEAGRAHVAYLRVAGEAAGDRCRRTSTILAVDVPAQGALPYPETLATFRAGGTGTADDCVPDDGIVVQAPLLVTDPDGADTAVYTALQLPFSIVTPLARHREPGAAWGQTEVVSTHDVVAERLVGGPGAPALVVRTATGRSVTTRAPDGAWTSPAPLIDGEAWSFDAARTGAGTTVFAWNDGEHVAGRVLGADGRLDAPHELAEGYNAAIRGVGGDADGDAAALYTEPGDDGFLLQLSGYDGAGPRITALSAPRAGIAGDSVPFAVAGFDVWSGPASAAAWDFGDGHAGEGLAAGHTYAAAGDYTVAAEVRDAAGNVTRTARSLRIAGRDSLPAPTIPPPTRHPPHLTRASLDPRHPRAGRAPALRFTTDQAGELRITLTRTAPGVRRGGRCVPGRSRGARCTRTVSVRRLRGLVGHGRVRFALPRLAAGSWRLTAVEKSLAGDASRPVHVRFTVRRAARGRSA